MLGEWSYAVYLGQTAWLLAIRFFEQRLYPAPDAIVLGTRFSSLIFWLEPACLVTICVLVGRVPGGIHRIARSGGFAEPARPPP